MSEKTHFGFQEVDSNIKASLVGQVFESVAPNYDVMNDLMSFGIHRLWKRFAILNAPVKPGARVLDLAGGTGDLAQQLAGKVGESGEVVLADINAAMLAEGRERLTNAGLFNNLRFVQVDAEQLPFADNHFDVVTMAFGLRNVTRKERALASIYRVLKPGGVLLVLEFSKPTSALLAKVYDWYSFQVIPRMGQWVANDAESYRYLAESIRMHPDQQSLCDLMTAAGFDRVSYHNLSQGIVALHKAYKF